MRVYSVLIGSNQGEALLDEISDTAFVSTTCAAICRRSK
jgi:hypothetical protein